MRRYNGPSCSAVAALIPGNEDGMIGKRDILVRKRGQANSNVNEVLDKESISHRLYEPLSYVILFPNGTDDGIRNCDSMQEKDKGSSHPPCSTAGACFREGMNSARRLALPALFCGSVLQDGS